MSVPFVGESVPRREDWQLVTGRGRYTSNLNLATMLHAKVVRSPFARARLISIDTSEARSLPGVVGVLSGEDLRSEWVEPLPMIWPVGGQVNVPEHWPLASDEVRFVGDGVAVVVAESLAAAEDAAEFVRVEYEALIPVVDAEMALAADAPIVHESLGTNRCFTFKYDKTDDIDQVFDRADVTVARTFRQQRVLASPIEPRVVVAEPHVGLDEFVLWTSTQIPHIVQRTLSACLGIPEHRLRVVALDVGGAFGSKLNVYAEEALMVALARRLGRPVKWVEERSEHASATTHGRAQLQRIELAASNAGEIKGIRVSLLASMGAYLQLESPGIPTIGRFLYGGAYAAEAYSFECIGVFTNQTPTGAYRGAGRPEAIYAIERMMDVLAEELDIDPVEIRRRNFLPSGEGIQNAAGIMYDSVDYERTLNRAVELVGYDDLRSEQTRRGVARSVRRLGVGVAFYVDASGTGPSAILAKSNYEAGGWEAARVRILMSGKVEVLTGTTSQGQGHETTWAQIAADTLGVGIDDVKVYHGDTGILPMGVGSFGSRSLVVGGSAIQMAANRVVAKARSIAAHLLEVAEEDVAFSDGRFVVSGAPDRSIAFADVALQAVTAHHLPPGMEPGLDEGAVLDPVDWSYPFGAHVAIVEVDMETGEVVLVRYLAVDDCGNVVNPMIVNGQIQGGIAQGVGQALLEEVVYGAEGQLESGSFTTYLIPSATDLPNFELHRTVTPSNTNPLGAKGVGEVGALCAPPAVMNAIHDALALGSVEIDMPATPERVWRAVVQAGAGSANDGPVA